MPFTALRDLHFQVRLDVAAHNSSSRSSRSSFSINNKYVRMGDTTRTLVEDGVESIRDVTGSSKSAWLAPELLGLEPEEATCASDIFALGMTIWEVFSNKDPYEDQGANDPMRLDDKFIGRILDEDLRPDMPKSMPIGVARLVTACWLKV